MSSAATGVKKRIRDQLLFWALLGPMTLLLTLLAATPLIGRFDLPIIAICGAIACWRWRLRALSVVLAALIGWVAWQLTTIAPEQRFWYLGVGIALALGFMVLCLSFDEVKASVSRLEGEARTRLDALMRLDDQSRKREVQFQLERDRALAQAAALEQRLRDLQRQHALQIDTNNLERRALADQLIALQLAHAQPAPVEVPVPVVVQLSGSDEQRLLLQEMRRKVFELHGELYLRDQEATQSRSEESALRHQLMQAVTEAQHWQCQTEQSEAFIDHLLNRQ